VLANPTLAAQPQPSRHTCQLLQMTSMLLTPCLLLTFCCAGTSWWRDTTNNRAFALTRANANATRSEDSFTDQERQLIVASWRQTGIVQALAHM
jgi:hypothetical protein